MRQIIYSSVQTPELGEGGVFEIIQTSVRNNTAKELRGFLIYSGQSFFQVLEGPDDAVSAVFEAICKDPRHMNIEVLRDQTIQQTHFERWAMQRIALQGGDGWAASLGALEEPVREAGILPFVEEFLESGSAKAA